MSIHSLIHFMGNWFEETAIWLGFGFVIFLVPAKSHWMSGSRQSRGGTFFNVRVEPGFANSDAGRAILLRFRWRIWLWAVLMEAIYFVGSFRWDLVTASLWSFLILYVTMIGCQKAFSSASRQTRQQATVVADPSVRTADLFAGSGVTNRWMGSLNWLGMVVPLAIPVAAACVVILHTRQLPSNASWYPLAAVFSAAIFGIIPAGTQFALHFRARSSDWNPDPQASQTYRTLVGLPQVLVFSYLSLQMCVMATMPLAPFLIRRRYFSFTFWGYALLFLLLFGIKWWLRRNVSRQSSDPMPDDCWKWGLFYTNPDDPAFVVPSRSGTGYSFNYGQRAVWITWVMVTAAIVIDLAQSFGMLLSTAH